MTHKPARDRPAPRLTTGAGTQTINRTELHMTETDYDDYTEQLAAQRGDPAIEYLNDTVTVTVTPTNGPTIQGYLWRLTPEVARVITGDDAMVELDRANITSVEPMRYGLGDRIAVTSYDGRFEADIDSILLGLLTLRLDDGRIGRISVSPPPGVTITSLRRATTQEQNAILTERGFPTLHE